MKLSSKPISSPNRSDKFPPPLTRFLRTNGGNRSRGRTRSSPMFCSIVRKKNQQTIETQEPSSPKVTCMGQVRIRRPKKSKNATHRRRCKWLHMPLLSNPFARKNNPHRSQSVWRKWFWCYQRKTQVAKESEKPDTEPKEQDEVAVEEEEDEEEEVNSVFISTPPKNALLLMRCRSEPRRASSLANRFWASPCVTEEVENKKTEQTNGVCDEEKPISDGEREEKVEMTMKGSSEPLILTRCKSEPASRTARLSQEAGFWKERRLGIQQPHV